MKKLIFLIALLGSIGFQSLKASQVGEITVLYEKQWEEGTFIPGDWPGDDYHTKKHKWMPVDMDRIVIMPEGIAVVVEGYKAMYLIYTDSLHYYRSMYWVHDYITDIEREM